MRKSCLLIFTAVSGWLVLLRTTPLAGFAILSVCASAPEMRAKVRHDSSIFFMIQIFG
jgi:hypothetical protein